MPLMEHIRELRNRLLKALLGLALGMVVGWLIFKPAWNFISAPFCRLDIQGTVGCGKDGHPLIVTGVFDSFFLRLKIAFVVGLILSSPVWLYQLWAFIAPGLYAREKRWTYAFVGIAVPLFALGGLFAYLAMGKAMGFFVGLIARALLPGANSMGFIATTILGILGSIVGGYGGRLISKPQAGSKFHPAGFFMSVVGAIVLLLVWRFVR